MKKKKKTPKSKLGRTTPVPVKTFDIVRIDWKDHWSSNEGWTDPADVRHKPFLCVTVGMVAKEDRQGITLTQNMDTNMKVANTTYILKNCIVKQTKLGSVEYAKD